MSSRPRVTVYVKAKCGLCGPFLEVVEAVRREVPFELEKVDITSDPALLERFGTEVPVLLLEGKKAFSGRVEAGALKKRLAKAQHATRHEDGEADHLETPVHVPGRGLILALVTVAALGFAYFTAQGVADARLGTGRLAERLLDVRPPPPAPKPFELPTMAGGQLGMEALRGKVAFVNFWATWCPPCIEEMPSMRRLHEKLRADPKFTLLAVSTDESWTPVRAFFGEPAPEFAVLLDKGGAVARQYGTEKFPETYVLVDGQLVGHIVGPRDWDTWYAEAYLRSLLTHGRLDR